MRDGVREGVREERGKGWKDVKEEESTQETNK